MDWSRRNAAFTVFFLLAILAFAGTAGYAITTGDQQRSSSEFYLLAENESGSLTANDYPQAFTAGEPQELVVGISNREQRPISYTVLVEVQRVQTVDGTTTVLETERLHRFTPRVAGDRTWRQRHDVAPTIIGERLRLTYMLYRGNPPANPSVDDAYRKLHIWVNVTAA